MRTHRVWYWQEERGPDQGGATDESQEPCYVISVAARMVGVHAQTLRYYEREGIIEPSRSRGNIRLYSPKDIERIRRVKMLMDDLGINLAGVEVVLRMSERMAQMEREMRSLMQELERLGSGVLEEPGTADGAKPSEKEQR